MKKFKLKNWPSEPPATIKPIQLVGEAASVFFNIPLTELRSKKRTNEVVWARSVAMWVSRNAKYSSHTVGKYWGRDHATVLHAQKLVDNLTSVHPNYNSQLQEFKILAKEYLKKHL
jgi:chromosomal replication initiator protein